MGQFDDEIDPNGGVSLTPDASLDPLAMSPALMSAAIPPPQMRPPVAMPTPPSAPPQAGGFQQAISAALMGLAAGLGPRHGGTGVSNGLMVGTHDNQVARQTEFKDKQLQYQQQQQEAIRQQEVNTRQQQLEAAQFEKRQQDLQKAVATIKTEVSTVKTKAEYDARLEKYANLLRGSGYRVDANWLREAIPPFMAPDSKKAAQTAIAGLYNNKVVLEQIKNDPAAAMKGTIEIDLNGDGILEKRTVAEVMSAAGMSLITDDNGQPVGLGTSTDGPIANIALKALLKDFRTENRRNPSDKEMVALVERAKKTPKDATPKEPAMMQVTEVDPDTGELVTSLVPKKPGEVSRRPPKEANQAQFQAGAYAGRMEQSGEILDQLEKKVAGMNTLAFAAQSRLPPAAQFADFQSYDQAGRNFINAVLRKESGAAISQSEFDNARRQYLPQPGDTPQTLTQKKANRDYAFQTMKQAAGRAYQPPIKVPNADDAIIAARKGKTP